MSTVPSTTQEFGSDHASPGSPSNKMKEIEQLEAKLAELRLGLSSSRKPNQTPEKAPTPKVMSPQKVPTTPNDGALAKPSIVGNGPIVVGEGNTIEAPNLNMVALQRIANLPDGDCKSALMAMCEAQMTQVDIEATNKLY